MSGENFGRDSTIIHLWNKNYTGSEIAAELGITRNAVMGVVHRFRRKGLVGYKPETKTVNTTPRPRPKATLKPKEKPLVYTEGKVTFAELQQSRQCHYVVNDGHASSYLFCGKPQERGSYCEHHASICYMPSKYRA